MSTNVTKILVRQGTNIVRKSSPGVTLDSGEPGYTVDTKRMYIGDGVTIGGIPIGVKNWGTYNPVFSTPSISGYSASVVSIISAVESGDIIYDSSLYTLYYATVSNPTSAQWAPYALTNSISGYNGIVASTTNNIFSAGLGAGFTVGGSSITLNYDTIINTGKNFTLNSGNVAVNGGGNIAVNGGGNITTDTGLVSALGGTSKQWNTTYSNVTANSASWVNTYTVVAVNSANWNIATTNYGGYTTTAIRNNDSTALPLLSFYNNAITKSGRVSATRIDGSLFSIRGGIWENVVYKYNQTTSGSIPYNILYSVNVYVSAITSASISFNGAYDDTLSVYINTYLLSSYTTPGNFTWYWSPSSGIGTYLVQFAFRTDGASPDYFILNDWILPKNNASFVSMPFVP